MYSTTNICERLFETAKHIMTPLRKLMLPSSLNALLLLKANRKVWSNRFVIQKIMDKRKAVGVDDDEEDNAAEQQEHSLHDEEEEF